MCGIPGIIQKMKNRCENVTLIFLYTIDLDCLTWSLNTEQRNYRQTGKASFDKIDVSVLGPWCMHHCFRKYVTYADLFKESISVNC